VTLAWCVVGADKERLANKAAVRGLDGPLGPFLEPFEDLEDRDEEEPRESGVDPSLDELEKLRGRFDLDEAEERLLSEGRVPLKRLKKLDDFLGAALVFMTYLFHERDQSPHSTLASASFSFRSLFLFSISKAAYMIPGWMAMLAQSASDKNEGLWPKDKATTFDPGNFCQQQTQSKDKFDADGARVKVRSSSSEGMFLEKEDCCRNLYCLETTCDKFDKSDCSKQDYNYACKIHCGSNPGPSQSKHHKPPDVDCASGPKYICGQDCSSEKVCYVQKDCTKQTTAGGKDEVYDASEQQCCVNYMELNGGRRQNPAFDEDTTMDDTLVRCEEVVKNRKTDYPQQEPEGPGGYKDCGEFGELCPSISPATASSPATAAPTTSHHHHHPHSMAPAATSPAGSQISPTSSRPTPLGARPASPTSSRVAPRLSNPHQAQKLSPRSQDPFGAHRRITTGLRGSSPTRPAVGLHGPVVNELPAPHVTYRPRPRSPGPPRGRRP